MKQMNREGKIRVIVTSGEKKLDKAFSLLLGSSWSLLLYPQGA